MAHTSLVSVFLAAAFAAFAPFASAQVAFPEAEPNNSKSNATVVSCMTAGDFLTGSTAGTSTSVGDTSILSADYFRVGTCALPVGIYRHRLTITTGGPSGHVGTIMGRDVVNFPPPTILATEVALQSSTMSSTPPNFVQWYGFGRGEQIYYRVTGTATTLAPYQATLSTTPVPVVAVPDVFLSGTITITTEGQAHSTDTELHVYDASLTPIPGFANDDTPTALPGGGSQFQSTLQRSFAPGTYYLLLSAFNLADDQLTGSDDAFLSGDVLDFPDAVLTSNGTPSSNVSFAITDSSGTRTYAAVLPSTPYEILWYQLNVGPAWSVTTYCYGDASGPGCPCANNGLTGRGCANSVNGFGAQLVGAGVPSVSADTFALQGSGMPNGSVLYFQGTTGLQVVFGDGQRCAGGTVIRLGPKTNVAGASQYPVGLDVPISVKGLVAPGDTRRYQAWYRDSAVFCSPSLFNLSNGVAAIWGP